VRHLNDEDANNAFFHKQASYRSAQEFYLQISGRRLGGHGSIRQASGSA